MEKPVQPNLYQWSHSVKGKVTAYKLVILAVISVLTFTTAAILIHSTYKMIIIYFCNIL